MHGSARPVELEAAAKTSLTRISPAIDRRMKELRVFKKCLVNEALGERTRNTPEG